MTRLSPVAETLLDYARSAAKRYWSPTINPLHMILALHRWDEEWFNQTFAGLLEAVESYLTAHKGDSLKPESTDTEVLGFLEQIQSDQDAKALGKHIETVGRDLMSKAKPPGGSNVTAKSIENHDSIQKQPTAHPNASTHEDLTRPLDLNQAFARTISECLDADYSTVRSQLACDARSIAFRVLGDDPVEVQEAISAALESAGELRNQSPRSDLLERLISKENSDKAFLATRLALAYVDIAEFAASLDDNISDEEIGIIDEIRLECRELLGNRIDATSDAVSEFEARFEALVGMESVKAELRRRADYLLVSKRRAQRGRATESHRMHMAFVGNPGTGKTTAARLFGQLLANLKLLPSEVFVETDRSGLVGQFVGHTEEKTTSVINQADGGVLFIDEAYALNDRYGNSKGFGEEALTVLVKEMEDRRERLLVVLAGYKRQMDEMLTVNPGLKSRIPSVIEFPDYSLADLIAIAHQVAKSRGLRLSESAVNQLQIVLKQAINATEFGNAREVENMIDSAQRSLADRLSRLGNLATEEESQTIDAIDIPAIQSRPKKRIGFTSFSQETP